MNKIHPFLFCCCLVAIFSIQLTNAQTDDLPETNGEIKSSILDSVAKKLYIGGAFSRIGNIGSFGAPVDTGTGLLPNKWPAFQGNVINAAIPDDSGGWYVGGDFDKVGTSYINNLVHVLADGSIDTNFIEVDLNVASLEKINNKLIVGGSFSYAAKCKELKSNVGVYNDTGAIDKRFPNLSGSVISAVSDGMEGWFISGNFSLVGDSIRNFIAHIDSTGKVSNWNVNLNGACKTMALMGNKLFIAGMFTRVNNQLRDGLAAMDKTSGTLLTWSPNAGGSGAIGSMQPFKGNLVIGGSFTDVNGTPRNSLASLDTSTGAVTTWNPNAVGGYVNTLAANDSLLFVGGNFSTISGISRNGLCIISGNTFLPKSFNPMSSGTNVNAILISGDTLFIGGGFSLSGPQTRQNGAAFNFGNGALLGWNPFTNIFIEQLALYQNQICIGGQFTSDFSGSAYYFSAYSRNNWNKTTFYTNPTMPVSRLAYSGKKLLVSGEQSNIGGISRKNLLSFDLTTKTITTWQPAPNNQVSYLKTVKNKLFVGGLFSEISSTSRSYLAVLDTGTLAVQSLNLNPNDQVLSIAANDSLVYFAGNFTLLGGLSRDRLASMRLSNNALTTWNPSASSSVKSISISGNKLFIGGNFTTVNAITRNKLAAIDCLSGLVFPWDPNANSNVFALTTSGNKVYAGGYFTNVGGQPRNYLAALDTSMGIAMAWNPNPDVPYISFLTASNSTIFVGGLFTKIGGSVRNNAACIDLQTNSFTSWNPNTDGRINTLFKLNDKIYAGGSFFNVGTISRDRFAVLDTVTGSPVGSIILDASGVVETMYFKNNVLYIGGSFSSVGTFTRNGAAAINTINHTVTGWNPDVLGSTVYCITENAGLVYLGGEFYQVGTQARAQIASVNNTTGAVTIWNPSITKGSGSPRVYSMLVNGANLIVAGDFNTVGSLTRNNIASVSLTTGIAGSWNPNANASIRSMAFHQSSLLVSGDFTYIGNDYRLTQGSIDLLSGFANYYSLYTSGAINNYHFFNRKIYLTGSFTASFPRIKKCVSVLPINTNGTFLPVRLLSFDAICSNDQLKLNWSTSAELNNKGFEIETSIDNTTFATAHFIKGNDNKQTNTHYSCFMYNFATNPVFIRLKQVDWDGKMTYSQTKYVSCLSTPALIITPNPAKDIISVAYNEESLSDYVIYDLRGNTVFKDAAYINSISLASLEPGIYAIQLHFETTTLTKKVVVIH
ncbi:MAG: T9SS type A sorting domain-containing protein [Bacteroidota bacterium]